MMNNLAQIAQLMRGRDPQSVAMSMIQNSKINDPLIEQLVTFAQKGDADSAFNLASTYFAKQGLDLNQELNSFMQMLQ